jgi:hypothetical protein
VATWPLDRPARLIVKDSGERIEPEPSTLITG